MIKIENGKRGVYIGDREGRRRREIGGGKKILKTFFKSR